ncbi:MAG: DNA repair protein RecO [Desulfobulbaceae bacterium DB1]|nr:MAG: DNA repair protein RecO [Desulfobulbaceae bacterium DB1]
MSYLQSRSIVIKVMDYGESDKIITFFTEDFGKVNGIAKGAKRSKKRFVNKLEFFSLLEITAVPSRQSSLCRIDSAVLLSSYPPLRENYKRYSAAMLVCELVDQWTRENDPDEVLFHLLQWCMEELTRTADFVATVLFFHVKLLKILGIHPQLDHCLLCGERQQDSRFLRFSLVDHGIICKKCESSSPSGTAPISLAAVKSLQMINSLPYEKLQRLKISDPTLSEIAVIMKNYTQFQLQREIVSWNQTMKF